MKNIIFLCLLVTHSVICSDLINAKKSYGFNGLFKGERYNEFKDRRGVSLQKQCNSGGNIDILRRIRAKTLKSLCKYLLSHAGWAENFEIPIEILTFRGANGLGNPII